MSSDYFRIVRGLELDEKVRILQGAGAPGLTPDTDAAQVGSFYLNTTTGAAFSKVSPGSGTIRWSGIAASGLGLYDEKPISPAPPGAAGDNSVAIGNGAQTDIGAADSIALGSQSFARHRGAHVFANGRFASTGDCQTGMYMLRTHTTNATPTETFLDGTGGSERLVLPDDATWTFKVTVTGHRTDVGDGHAGYEFRGVIFRQAGASTVSFQGSPVKTVLAESNAQWDVTIAADTANGSLRVRVQGQAGKTIRWAALVETVEVTN